MKITKAQLKNIIKEELEAALDEFQMPDQAKDITKGGTSGPVSKQRCASLAKQYKKLAAEYEIASRSRHASEQAYSYQLNAEMDKLLKSEMGQKCKAINSPIGVAE